jgi:hypothetical protein
MKRNYFIFLLFVVQMANAQIVTQKVNLLEPKYDWFKFTSGHEFNFNKPTVDKEAIAKFNQQESPNLIALGINANIDITREKPDFIQQGLKYSIKLKVKGAKFLSLFFDDIDIAQGSEMYIYNPKENILVGPINNENYGKSSHLLTGIITGDELIITLIEDVRVLGKSKVHLGKIYSGGEETTNYGGLGLALGCNINAKCPEGLPFSDQSDAVTLVLIPTPDGLVTCSASLINNACQNLKPNLLTAFHCLDFPRDGVLSPDEKADVNNWSFVFQYRSPNCSNIDGSDITIVGSKLISAWNQTDYALLELNSKPYLGSGIKYAGWSRTGQTPTSSFGFHHPRGDIMKVSLDGDAATQFTWDNIKKGGFSPSTTNAYWQVDFDANKGTIEEGSSGSPLFDQNKRVVGQLRGNQLKKDDVDFCTDRRAHYGRLDLSWNGGGTSTSQLSSSLSDDPSVTQTNTIGIPGFNLPDVICGPLPLALNMNGVSNMSFVGGGIQGIDITGWLSGVQPQAGYTGPGFLEFKFKPSGITCNTPLVIRKDFQVGHQTPQVTFIEESGDCFGWLTVDNPLPGYTYSWTILRGPNWYTHYRTGSSVFLHNLGNGQAWMSYELTATNECGSSLVIGNGNLTGCSGPYLKGNDSGVAALLSKNHKPTLSISPNPATHEITLNIKDLSPTLLYTLCDVNILNQMGQVVMSQKLVLDNTLRLDINSLANGFYVAQVKGENGLFLSQKLMVNKK